MRRTLARLRVEVGTALRFAKRVVHLQASGSELGAEPAIAKLYATELLQRIAAEGFTLLATTMAQPWKERAEKYYAENKGFMLSGTSIVLQLRATNSIAKLRTLMAKGSTDAEEATQQAPDYLKNATYVYCSDSAESAKRDLALFFSAEEAFHSTKQYTLAIIKPDAVANGKAEEIVNRIVYEGFVVREQLQLKLSKERAKEFYVEHERRDFFDELIAFMTSGELVALKLEREDAVHRWRAVMGSTNFKVARKESPQSVRALYATSMIRNATHGSDSTQSAKRELAFFFTQLPS